MVSPGEAPWAKRSTGSVPRAAALAANFVEAERKSRSETAEFGDALFMSM
jgi:hypothetical protein